MMDSDLDQVRNMANINRGSTETPDYGGGVDYFYVGAYSGGDDALDGILDNLLTGGIDYQDDDSDWYEQEGKGETYVDTYVDANDEHENLITRTSSCAYGDCPVVVMDDENESLIVNSEPPTDTGMEESEFVRDSNEYSLVLKDKGSPLEIGGGVVHKSDKSSPKHTKIFSMNTKTSGGMDIKYTDGRDDNVKLTEYSKVHDFITGYVKSIGNDKTVKGNE